MVSARTHANGPADAGRTRLLFAAEIFPDECFQSLFNPSSLSPVFAAAAGWLCCNTTFNLINELDDVSPGGYRWTRSGAGGANDLTAHTGRTLPFIALLGGIVGLGQLSKNSELTAIRNTGFYLPCALVALVAGILWTVSLGAIDEWVASPLQLTGAARKSNRPPPRWGGRMTLPAICCGPGAAMNLADGEIAE